jgi:hypothetical protein
VVADSLQTQQQATIAAAPAIKTIRRYKIKF